MVRPADTCHDTNNALRMASPSEAYCPFLNTGTEQSETWGRVQGHLSRQTGLLWTPHKINYALGWEQVPRLHQAQAWPSSSNARSPRCRVVGGEAATRDPGNTGLVSRLAALDGAAYDYQTHVDKPATEFSLHLRAPHRGGRGPQAEG